MGGVSDALVRFSTSMCMSLRIKCRAARGAAAACFAAKSSIAVLAALALPLALSACSSGSDTAIPSVGLRQQPQPAPRVAARVTAPRLTAPGVAAARGGGGYKLGQPYRIGSQWYVPREEPDYERRGVASWYGADFQGRATANGEVYNMDALSAAHPTLPLPSYVLVTNVGNQRTILVRVNDRGPYAGGRLIDLSRAAARALGYEGRGTADVVVRYGGRAPLNGDDTRERAYLAAQPWTRDLTAEAGPVRPQWQGVATAAPTPPTDAGGWSADTYRHSSAQVKSSAPANAARPNEDITSWLPAWGLGTGVQ